MMQRNVLADLNAVSARLDADAAEDRLRQGDHAPVRRPVQHLARDGPAQVARRRRQQYQRNIEDAQGWQEATEQALGEITDSVQRARELLVQGATDSADPAVARRDRRRDRPAHRGHQAERQRDLPRPLRLRRQRDRHAARTPQGADDAYHGDEAGWTRRARHRARDRPRRDDDDQHRRARVPRRRPGRRRRQAARHAARRRRPPARRRRRRRCAAPTSTRLDAQPRRPARRARPQRRHARTGSRPRSSRLAEVEESTLTQLSETEDADIAKTLIDFNSQQAAYQAALKAGANIVQASLMDFLR